jgi:LPXTG-motif cell wall-anchored protein
VTRFALALVAVLSILVFALPAAAQQTDPYGGALPGDITRPGDVTVPPTGVAPAPGVAVPAGEARAVEGRAPGGPQRAGAPAVPAPSRNLAATGAFTVGLLALALALLVAGGGAVFAARRRRRALRTS